MDGSLCPVCYFMYNSEDLPPLMLSCGHSICKTCYDRIILSINHECPICKSQLDPNTEPNTNYSLLQLINERQIIEMSRKGEKLRIQPAEEEKIGKIGKIERIGRAPDHQDHLPPERPHRYKLIPPDENPSPEVRCPRHAEEPLEWYLEPNQTSCLICKTKMTGEFGHWKCKHEDFRVCVACKTPTYKTCPGHPTNRLKWGKCIRGPQGVCRICGESKSMEECSTCQENCIICNQCNKTHFMSLQGATQPTPQPLKTGCVDWFCPLLCLHTLGALFYCCGPIQYWYKMRCDKCHTTAKERAKTGECYFYLRYTPEEALRCERCIKNYCAFHPNHRVYKGGRVRCMKCHASVLAQGGLWMCEGGDFVICNNCFFYPDNSCPIHPRIPMDVAPKSLNADGGAGWEHESCSVCSIPGPAYKCPHCRYFVCGRCVIRPIYCPTHVDTDLQFQITHQNIICAICYRECSGLGIYACPKGDCITICDTCYRLNPYCPQNIQMGWVCPLHSNQSLKFGMEDKIISCLLCKAEKSAKFGFYECKEEHDYKVCYECLELHSKVPREVKTCPNHDLEELQFKLGEIHINCVVCKQSKDASFGYYVCPDKDYFLCEGCHFRPPNEV